MVDSTTGEAPLPPSDQAGNGGSSFWILVCLIIELALLANLFIVTRYTVIHRSGLNEPDKIRRIWARATDIRYQPVMRPLIFAIGVSYGAQSVLHGLFNVLMSVLNVDLNNHMNLYTMIPNLVLVGASSYIAILVYRACGGTNWKACGVATLLFDWFMGGILLTFARGYTFKTLILISIMYLIVLCIVQIPCYIFGAYRRMPPTSRLIYNSSVVPNWVKLDRTILVASAPLAVSFLISYICEQFADHETYIGRIVIALAILVVLSCAALASIISVNRALLSNEFQWQWRAFLTPSIPLGLANVLLSIVHLFSGSINFLFFLWYSIHLLLGCGSCGVLGAYVYLKWAELYAQRHLDDDVLAQDDLLAEFDEDEDNEELDV